VTTALKVDSKIKYRNQNVKRAAQASGATKSVLDQRTCAQSVSQENIRQPEVLASKRIALAAHLGKLQTKRAILKQLIALNVKKTLLQRI
jgi:hypothetical protein